MTNLLIIGAGAIAEQHLQSCLTLGERARVVAISDLRVEKAQKLIDQHALSAEAYADYREALKRADIQAVSICAPPSLHAEIAQDCLNAGKHILLEKPMASSLEECDKILEAARRNDRLVSVVAQSRFLTSSYNIKRLLDSGDCGRLLYAQAYSVWWRGGCYYDLDWRGRWQTEGGGCTLNHAVHHIDLLLWMAGMPTEITAMMTNLTHTNSEEEDLSMALLRFQDGAVGQITSSLVHHGEQQQMVFQTEKAGISIPFDLQCSRSMPNGFPEPDDALSEQLKAAYHALPALAYEGHTGQMDDFLHAIETGAPLLLDGMTGRNAIEVIVGIYKASATGLPVKLPLGRDDPFYTKEGVVANAPRFFEKTRSVETAAGGPITMASARFHSEKK